MVHNLNQNLIFVLSCVLIGDSASASKWNVNVVAFVQTPLLRKATESSLEYGHCPRRAPNRVTTRLFLEVETEDSDNSANDSSFVTTKSNSRDGDSGSFATTFLASFPELSSLNRMFRLSDLIRSLFRRLASLSLQDYNWRSDYFKKTEADRQVEESFARMIGEDATYVRPMDATDDKIGPLGLAERKLVEWLSLVIEEEGRRARMIASSEGDLVRPIDLQPSGNGGPLSLLESSAVSFLESIRTSEEERAKTLTLRPKDLDEKKRGPLGEAEYKAVETIGKIRDSELLRMEQTRRRGGKMVRPIDVPGPLGELEMWYTDLFSAELERARAIVRNDGSLKRPKDITMQGPMGNAEQQVSDALDVIKNEETERLRSIQQVLKKNRPMDNDRDSVMGLSEAFIVGIFKGPQLILRVIDRVNELLQSSPLQDGDDDILNDLQPPSTARRNGDNNEFEDFA